MSAITRPKRTKQYTKEELLDLIKEFNNDKEKIAKYLNIGTWSLRDQLKRNDIEFDGRKIAHNKKEIPPKYVLEDMYFNQNMSLVEMSKHLDASNCTIKKWFDFYNIKILSMSDTIKYKCMPKIIEHNRKNYGVDYFYQTEQFKEISKETCMKRYGKPYHPSKNTSIVELEVLNFFNSIEPGFEKDVIDNYELDGYNKKYGIAFEYCGLY